MVTIFTASLTFNNSTFCPHSVFMCFVWIWEKTAIISLHSINWLVFLTETECVYCTVRTGSVVIAVTICTASLTFNNSTFFPHSVFMCFVWIWEQTAIISLYNINWLVFITETVCVYCTVRTGSVVIAVTLCTVSLTFDNSTFFPRSVFMCFVWIWEQTAIISLYNINWLVFITETVCVYCAVRTGSVVIVVTICTTSLTFTILRSARKVYLCALCGSQNKQRLFPYTALTDWFL